MGPPAAPGRRGQGRNISPLTSWTPPAQRTDTSGRNLAIKEERGKRKDFENHSLWRSFFWLLCKRDKVFVKKWLKLKVNHESTTAKNARGKKSDSLSKEIVTIPSLVVYKLQFSFNRLF